MGKSVSFSYIPLAAAWYSSTIPVPVCSRFIGCDCDRFQGGREEDWGRQQSISQHPRMGHLRREEEEEALLPPSPLSSLFCWNCRHLGLLHFFLLWKGREIKKKELAYLITVIWDVHIITAAYTAVYCIVLPCSSVMLKLFKKVNCYVIWFLSSRTHGLTYAENVVWKKKSPYIIFSSACKF